jgi:hypothetical protein
MNPFYKAGDFALLSGQLVEILDAQHGIDCAWRYKVRLLNDNLTHWVVDVHLKSLPSQTAPKVLFSSTKR